MKLLDIITVDKYRKTLVLSISLIISGITLFYSKSDDANDKEQSNSNIYVAIFFLLFGIGYFAHVELTSRLAEYIWAIPVIASSILAISLIIYTLVKVNSKSLDLITYIVWLVISLIVIIGLAVFFYIFSNFLKSLTGWTGFYVQLLFYIPCLLLSFIHYIINEFKLTTSPVLILFVTEIVLLLLYVYLPVLINNMSNADGIPILEESVFLSTENTFPVINQHIKNSNFAKTFIEDGKPVGIDADANEINQYNYTLSMWTYLNNHGENRVAYNTESNIFNYGDGKPKITFNSGSGDAAEPSGVYRIYFTNNTDLNDNGVTVDTDDFKPYYELKLPSQKWNQLVFNYTSTHVDLFINGRLERTFSLKNKLPRFTANDVIKTGKTSGLHGAISNIRYFPKTLSKQRIASMYNLFMKKTPPVNNL